jgi:minor extracellular protease Epr
MATEPLRPTLPAAPTTRLPNSGLQLPAAPPFGTFPVARATAPASPTSVPLMLWDDVEPFEILVLDGSLDQAQRRQSMLESAGLRLVRRIQLPGLDSVLSTFLAPDEQRYLQYIGPAYNSAPNHRYTLMGEERAPVVQQLREALAWPTSGGACRWSPRIGLIDTPVNVRHPLLVGARIDSVSVLTPGMRAASDAHGTGVASVLVGQRETPALLPKAHLLAVNAFFQREGKVFSTAELLILALDQLLVARAEVINLSLGGPSNRLLEQITQRVHDRGILLVAAAGNGGPNSPPTYPAAYEQVVAVVAVDVLGEPDAHAPRGAYLDFAAPGVDIPVADTKGRTVYRSGSSYAAPFVTALLAVGIPESHLRKTARDLGAPGRDDTYGWGMARGATNCTEVQPVR